MLSANVLNHVVYFVAGQMMIQNLTGFDYSAGTLMGWTYRVPRRGPRKSVISSKSNV